MATSNKTIFATGKAMTFVLLAFLAACDCPPCPTPTPPPCPAPNPLISRQNIGFSAMPGTAIQGAVSVIVSTKDAQNQALNTDTIAPISTRFYQYGNTAVRPIQLNFIYKSASGETLAEDMLRVDDSETGTGGVTAMDVVMGLTAPNPPVGSPPNCPTMAAQSIATGTGSVNFAWSPEDWFVVNITHNSVLKTFGLHAKASIVQGAAGAVVIYRSDLYNCLGNPAVTVAEDDESATVETSSTSVTCKVTGTDNNDNQTPRRINIAGPSGCSITVTKKQ